MTEVNFAPAGATHYDFFAGYLRWLKYEKVWMYFDDSEWWPCEEDLQPEDEKEIPARERELNRLAEESAWQLVSMQCKNETWDLTKEEWQHRRAERIEAGLIEVDNPVTSSVTNSQAKEMEIDMLKGENTEPEYTHEYSDYGVMRRCTIFCDEKDASGNIIVKNNFDDFVLVPNGHVFPLKTPKQKARDDFALAAVEAAETYDFGEYFTAEGARKMFDWVTDQGVDLTPIVEEQTSD